MEKNTLEALFGGGSLTWDELMKKAGESGMEIGDVGSLKSEYRRERAVRTAEKCLGRARAKNPELVKKMLDTSRAEADDGGDIEGELNGQIEALKKAAPYMFEESEGGRLFSSGTEHGSAKVNPDELDDVEYYKTIKKI